MLTFVETRKALSPLSAACHLPSDTNMGLTTGDISHLSLLSLSGATLLYIVYIYLFLDKYTQSYVYLAHGLAKRVTRVTNGLFSPL